MSKFKEGDVLVLAPGQSGLEQWGLYPGVQYVAKATRDRGHVTVQPPGHDEYQFYDSRFELAADAEFRETTFGPLPGLEQGATAPARLVKHSDGVSQYEAKIDGRTVDIAVFEQDPTGKQAHEPGAKLDAGKLRPSLVLGGFAQALKAVVKVGTDGANKYTDNGWREVPNGFARYSDAKCRHALAWDTGETHDKDTGSLHLAHEAWNALARLELYLQNNPGERV